MRVLVAGWIGSTNLGDELVFAGMRELLERRGIRPVAVSQDPVATRTDHGVNAVSGIDPYAITRAIGQADAVILGGGGLLQDDSSVLNLPFHLSRVALAGGRGTPFAGVGLGVGGLSTTFGRGLVRRAMRSAVAISVRDQPSAELLAEVGVPGAVLAADTAFALPAVFLESSLAVLLLQLCADIILQCEQIGLHFIDGNLTHLNTLPLSRSTMVEGRLARLH